MEEDPQDDAPYGREREPIVIQFPRASFAPPGIFYPAYRLHQLSRAEGTNPNEAALNLKPVGCRVGVLIRVLSLYERRDRDPKSVLGRIRDSAQFLPAERVRTFLPTVSRGRWASPGVAT